MAKVAINVSASASGGHPVVVIDGAYIGLDPNGNGTGYVNKPPTGHWYDVILYGQPNDSVQYNLTGPAGAIGAGNMTIAVGQSFVATYQQNFV